MTPFAPLNWFIALLIALLLGVLAFEVLIFLFGAAVHAIAVLVGILVFFAAIGAGGYYITRR